MTYLEALYGSQYSEIVRSGKDGSKGRFNGNIFLAAFIFLCLLVVIAFFSFMSNAFLENANRFIASHSGNMSGKTFGKLLAIPVFALIYIVVSKTVGNETNFVSYVERYMKHPEIEKKKANAKILTPFFIALGLLVFLVVFS